MTGAGAEAPTLNHMRRPKSARRRCTVKKKVVVPEPVKREGRICFGIAYFTTEADAAAYDRHVREQGRTYNGGYFDGMPCGRAKEIDHVKNGRKLFAVTE